jgi:hydroxymethylpyrimidine pyrophosphatase-like HAD family hydrolase
MTFPSRRALILDLDFTLLHLEFIPDPIEVPGRTRSAYIAPQTVDILRDLQAKFDLVLATARSLDGTDWVVNGLKNRGVEVAALVLEDGARLGAPNDLRAFDADFEVAKWRARLETSNANESSFEWQFDFENCLVARCENGEIGEVLLQKWAENWSAASHNARFFRDGRKVYALPARADKWSALQLLLGEKASEAAGVGDGANDLVWLPRVATPATFARAKPVLVEAVRARGGMVCESDGHDGIAQILRGFL